MKRKAWFCLVVLVGLFLGSGRPAPAQERVDLARTKTIVTEEVLTQGAAAASMSTLQGPEVRAAGMPARRVPAVPIPYHEPGHPSKAAGYSTQVDQIDAAGVQETVTLTGLDALLADDVIDDPLAGNYRLVDLDNILVGANMDGLHNTTTFTFTSGAPGTVQAIPGSVFTDTRRVAGITAGDLNGDGQDEQISAWGATGSSAIWVIGEMPGSPGRITSAPAAGARAGLPGEYALQFNGVDSDVDVPPLDLHSYDTMAIEAWVKPADITTNRCYEIIRQDGSSWPDWLVSFQEYGAILSFGLHAGGSYQELDVPIAPAAFTDGRWHRILATYDGATQRLYVDGREIGIQSRSGNIRFDPDAGHWIGSWNGTEIYNGRIDQISIWNQVPDDTDQGLVARWSFEEGSGTTTADATGHGYDGTLTSASMWISDNAPLGPIHLLARGYDQALWHGICDADGGACQWSNAGGVLASGPAVASRGGDTFDVYALGVDNLVYHRHWDGHRWSDDWVVEPDDPALALFRGDAPQRTVPMPELPAPAAVARGTDEIDLFRQAPDNTLRWRHYDGSDWGAWQNLGGMLASAPGAVSLNDDHMQVFARGVDEAMWTLTYDGAWGTWQRIEREGMPVTVTIASAPTAISPAAGQIAVYVRGSDDRLWEIEHDGGSWDTWQSLDEGLVSGVGVVVRDGDRELFARSADGSLQRKHYNGSTWSAWQSGGGLQACCQASPADFTWKESHSDIPNAGLDVTTGHFTGDGRSQIVVAYLDDISNVRTRLYDVQNGFEPTLLAEAVLSHLADAVYVSAGDLDGDGVDEIAVLWRSGNSAYTSYVVFLNVIAGTPWSVVQQGTPLESQRDNYRWRWMHFDMAPGDLDGDGDQEVAVAAMVRWYADRGWRRSLQIVDAGPAGEPKEAYFWWPDSTANFGWGDWVCRGCAELETGNLDGVPANGDEIVVTWAHPHPTQPINIDRRTIEVLRKTSGQWGVDTLASYSIVQETSIFDQPQSDALAVGDFDRDLHDEIAYYYATWPTASSCVQHLDVYRYDPGGIESLAGFEAAAASWNGAELVGGSFTGEGLRVGPPSYREQDRVDSVLTVLNMPPKHWDMLRKPDGTYETIQILNEECWTSPVDPKCTHSLHGSLEGTSSRTTVATQRNWAMSKGTEWKFSNLLLLEGSLKESYGEDVFNEESRILGTTFTNDSTAAYDDLIIYYGNSYQVWEYPLYIDSTDEPARYITVVFPNVSQGNYPNEKAGAVCDEGWYAPRHQPYNVWSYDPVSDQILPPDYLPVNGIYDNKYTGTESEFRMYFSELTGVKETSSQTHGISSDRGIGFELSGSVEIGVSGIFAQASVSKNFENRFKAYVQSDYNYEEHVTDEVQATDATYFSAYVASTVPADHFQARALAYWSTAGPLVLDWQTKPVGTSATWLRYNKPDPAFILPWYGFPDPDNLPYADPNNQGRPPCGAAKQLFSHDVVVDPPFASVGDTVTISATVRNFSDVPANNVVVRFYLGEPGENQVIGQAGPIALLSREAGPRTVSIDWTATGAGRQKIYAVIDPSDAIDEMHDEDDLSVVGDRTLGVDNNTAYGLIQIGAAGYSGMGAHEEHPYDGFTYRQEAGSIAVSLYVPPENMSAVTRFDVWDADLGVQAVGNPFQVVAFQGTNLNEWGEPVQPFALRAGSGDPPAVITLAYGDADLGGRNEADLRLYRRVGSNWAEATCAGYSIYRFPEDNLIAVPVCETGIFALSDETPGTVANRAPDLPRSPIPADGAVNVPITSILDWQGGDPDGDTVTYAIALSTTNPPPYVATTLLTQYTPELSAGQTYYWTISASDGISDTVGPTWRFSTVGFEHVYLPLVTRLLQ
jgi:hypothetical protein